jgi:putative ABC transport system permease protein
MFKHLIKLIWNKKRQNALLITEIFFSFLVIFAVFTLAVYAFRNYKKPIGIDYENVWVINYTNSLETKNIDSLTQFYELFKKNLKSMPEIIEASYTSPNTPFASYTITSAMYYNKNQVKAHYFSVDEDYQKTLNIKLMAGRWYNRQDMVSDKKVIVINKAFKEKAFGAEEAVGKFLVDNNGGNKTEIIGVLDDVKFKSNYESSASSLYSQYDSSEYKSLNRVLIKVSPHADAAFENRLYKTVSNSLKNANVEIEHLPNKLISANKFMLVPLIILSIVAGFLIVNVALGLFGVLWYNINKRRGEIGLRKAVGATNGSVSAQLVFESLILATFSLILGSFFAVQFPLLNVFDLPSAVYVIALILAILFIYLLVLICSLYPGRQAAGIYPAIALHED